MTVSVRADFVDGRTHDGAVAADALISGVKAAARSLVDWPVGRIVDLVDEFATRLLDRSCPLHRAFPGSGLPFIAAFCRRSQVEALLDDALEDRARLDHFVASSHHSGRAHRAFPRGLAVHWMAGNVPTLGFLSLIQGVLTKNANIVKVASASDRMLAELLAELGRTGAGQKMSGAELVRSISVIRWDHADKATGALFSRAADCRVIWGSDEAAEDIRALATGLVTVDLVFPSRTSLVGIGRTALQPQTYAMLAQRIAADASVFEQKACASPHTVFLETDDDAVVDAFAEELAKAMDAALRILPKAVPSEREVAAILNLRAQYDISDRAWYPQSTAYTVFADRKFQLGPAIGNRTVFVRRIDRLEKLAALVTPKVQSMGLQADGDEWERVTSALGAAGIQRFARLAAMTQFESPWDGFFAVQRLVRWVSRPVRH